MSTNKQQFSMASDPSLLTQQTTLNCKIPWEPYKAATNTLSNKKLHGSRNEDVHKTSSLTNMESKDNLIKYKIDTNLQEFNSQRPGFQHDSLDLDLLNDHTGSKFLDARFYTDAYFLKLASSLKKNSSADAKTGARKSPEAATCNKPVNVVGPLMEKTKQTGLKHSIENNSIKYWGKQREQYEKKIDYLESQLSGVYEQLNIQTQVNAELKKMLIASVGGEDMQYKLERLINDKLRYEYELGNNTKTIDKMSEQIEQISIQCDLWRSKFLAAKLISEEYLTWKSFLLMLNSQNEKLIKNLLEDNELLNGKLNKALELFVDLKEKLQSPSVQPIHEMKKKSPQPKSNKSLNNLQAINVLLTNVISLEADKPKHDRLLAEINDRKAMDLKAKKAKTMNELIGEELLEQFQWVKTSIQTLPNILDSNIDPSLANYSHNSNYVHSLDTLERLIKQIKLHRTNKFSRLYQPEALVNCDLLLNVCNKCKGDIKTV